MVAHKSLETTAGMIEDGDSESIATKVCSQIGRKRNAMFESHVVTSVARTSFDFRFEVVLSNLPL